MEIRMKLKPLLLMILIGALVVAVICFSLWSYTSSEDISDPKHLFLRSENSKTLELTTSSPGASPRDTRCTYHTCFDVYHCGYNDKTRISVYIYPVNEYVDQAGNAITLPLSKEFYEMLEAIADSPYYTNDPEMACLIVPSVDLLNQNSIRLREVGQILASLPWWNNGNNHLLFNMLPGSSPDYSTVLEVDTGKAVIAGGGFSTWSYRRTFDVSIPIYNPLIQLDKMPQKSYLEKRRYLVISSQTSLHKEYRDVLHDIEKEEPRFLFIQKCPTEERTWNFSRRCKQKVAYDYPQILQDSTFCLVIRGARIGQPALFDVMSAGCIPVIVADGYILPFSEVLDWKRIAVTVLEDDLENMIQILESYSQEKIYELRQQVNFIWQKYFSSPKVIALTTLQIINDRVFPYAGKSYEDWNDIPNTRTLKNPLFLPLRPPSAQGFTAVILTYDRLESLFKVIHSVAKVPSLAKVVVVWNNQKKSPPPMTSWPDIGKPLKFVKTRKNKMSNRFFPYDEIQTECILALDDDIVMLTADELEFAYEVWREFPDRLVGFPSRVHLLDNTTNKWKYESEWTNDISMVLTGAAFYHKYFSYLYTHAMPVELKTWVDEHMNCEDIAMNFLMSNVTGKAAIKVTPRKKFKCPECVNTEMLSSDLSHMIERSDCINQFTRIYQSMPLKNIEFRADPVLYKDDFPDVLKKYKDIGML
ncbi:exostosin-2-like isoform X1 [Mytilus galloprovincialis]|uniref:exostosin-2-like isoform X1 n=1 Tax=Mytilus galloprovincialis TaxID=29158 RepID=UPI003F7B68E5